MNWIVSRGIPAISAPPILPADRLTIWKPGVTYNTVPGLSTPGIPVRSTIYTTVNPTGVAATDVAAIQAAVDGCPDGQVVLLGAGTFAFDGTSNTTSGPIFIGRTNPTRKITVRGSGPGITIISKTNGSVPQPGQGTGPNPSCAFQIDPGPNNTGYNGVPPNPWDTAGGSTSTLQGGGVNLASDGSHGAMSVTVTDATGFTAGMFVNLDELSGGQWMPDVVTYNAAHGYQIWASSDYKTTWKLHNPLIPGVDDFTAGQFPYQAGTTGDFANTRLDRPHCEIKEIASVVGNVITFTSPIHGDYRVSHTAQLCYFADAAVTQKVAHLVGCGVENLTIKGFDANCISMSHAAYCWAQQVECDQWAGQCFSMYACFRCEYRRFFVHGATYPRPTSGAYNWTLDAGSSEALFEDGVTILGNKAMTARRSGAGSVVGYCYADMGMIDYTGLPSWVEIGINGSHLGGCHHMLFEGNWGWNGDSDNTHGPSVYHTYFRNWLTGFRSQFTDPFVISGATASFSTSVMNVSATPDSHISVGMLVTGAGVPGNTTIASFGSGNGGTGTYNLSQSVGTIGSETVTLGPTVINDATQSSNGPFRCGACQDYSYWMSFIGNVMGVSGSMGSWVYERTFGQNVQGIWMMGWCSGFDTTPSVDPQVSNNGFAGHIIRDGNWDWLNSQQKWENTPGKFYIPDTLYCHAAQPFFSGYTWPWVVPSNGITYTLPAKARYDTWVANGTPNPAA